MTRWEVKRWFAESELEEEGVMAEEMEGGGTGAGEGAAPIGGTGAEGGAAPERGRGARGGAALEEAMGAKGDAAPEVEGSEARPETWAKSENKRDNSVSRAESVSCEATRSETVAERLATEELRVDINKIKREIKRDKPGVESFHK